MTIQGSGSVSSLDVARQLNGPSGYSFYASTGDDSLKRLVKKTSNITYPTDFHGKGWGQQMNDLAPDSYNAGNQSNMKPYLMDRRSDGNSNQQYNNVALDSSKSWFGGVYLANSISNGSPRDVAFNGYFYIHNPYLQGPQFDLNGYVQYESTWQYGPEPCRTSFNLIGFSDGYLSGNRKTLASMGKDGGSKGAFAPYNYYDSGYRHVCVNLSQGQGGAGTSYAWMYNGSAN